MKTTNEDIKKILGDAKDAAGFLNLFSAAESAFGKHLWAKSKEDFDGKEQEFITSKSYNDVMVNVYKSAHEDCTYIEVISAQKTYFATA